MDTSTNFKKTSSMQSSQVSPQIHGYIPFDPLTRYTSHMPLEMVSRGTQFQYSDTLANEDNSFRNHIR